MATIWTVSMPVSVAFVSGIRSGISPMRVRVTAKADFEIDVRL